MAVLALVAAGLSITASFPADEMTVIAAVDLSESMSSPSTVSSIRRALDQLAHAVTPADRLGIVAFGRRAEVWRPPRKPSADTGPAPSLPADATDIRGALLLASALIPEGTTGRIVLLSDGHQNRNDARAVIAELRSRGIPVDVWPPAPVRDGLQGAALERMIAEPVVNTERPFAVRLVVRNFGPARAAVVRLLLDGKEIDAAPAQLAAGLNAFDLSHVFAAPGTHVLRSVVEVPGDPEPADNWRETLIAAVSPMRVLLAAKGRWSPLQPVLERAGAVVRFTGYGGLSAFQPDLARFHAVILEDPAAADLPRAMAQALTRYVEAGGALILTGGAATFGDPGFRSSPLERLSPVSFEPTRPRPARREPLALFLLVDRSNSMGYNSRHPAVRDGEKLRYAKEAALAVVRQLKDHDLVGVIAFDSHAWEISALRPLRESRSELERLIPKLVENGGTDFFEALEDARRQLLAARVGRKHIILLTDGDTNRAAADHYPLIERLARDEISVTTIRIGTNDVNLQLLQDISQRTGGQFHHVVDVTLLPELMQRDTTRAMGVRRSGEREFLPAVARPAALLKGIAESQIPPLRDYAYTRPRPGAEVVLEVLRGGRHDPILAVWPFGLGRVVAFTAALTSDAAPWLAWEQFGRLWAQTVHWAAGHAAPAEYALYLQREDRGSRLVVRSFDPLAEPEGLSARIVLPDGQAVDVPLHGEGPRTFAGEAPPLPDGRVEVVLVARSAAGRVTQQTVTLHVPQEHPPRTTAELRRPAPNTALLHEIAERTGGEMISNRWVLPPRKGARREQRAPLDAILLPLVMLLFTGEIAFRMLRPRVSDSSSIDPAPKGS